jgi:hypothetical protein
MKNETKYSCIEFIFAMVLALFFTPSIMYMIDYSFRFWKEVFGAF